MDPTTVPTAPGVIRRAVHLDSHKKSGSLLPGELTVGVMVEHAYLSFQGFWSGSQVSMSISELVEIREAIDEVLAEVSS